MRRGEITHSVMLALLALPALAITTQVAIGDNLIATIISLVGVGSIFGAGITYQAMRGAIRENSEGHKHLRSDMRELKALVEELRYEVGLQGSAGLRRDIVHLQHEVTRLDKHDGTQVNRHRLHNHQQAIELIAGAIDIERDKLPPLGVARKEGK